MLKSDLLKLLEKYPDNTEIYLSRDEEGNGFNRLYQIEDFYKVNDDFHSTKWSARDCCMTDEEFLEMQLSAPKVLIFWP